MYKKIGLSEPYFDKFENTLMNVYSTYVTIENLGNLKIV